MVKIEQIIEKRIQLAEQEQEDYIKMLNDPQYNQNLVSDFVSYMKGKIETLKSIKSDFGWVEL